MKSPQLLIFVTAEHWTECVSIALTGDEQQTQTKGELSERPLPSSVAGSASDSSSSLSRLFISPSSDSCEGKSEQRGSCSGITHLSLRFLWNKQFLVSPQHLICPNPWWYPSNLLCDVFVANSPLSWMKVESSRSSVDWREHFWNTERGSPWIYPDNSLKLKW